VILLGRRAGLGWARQLELVEGPVIIPKGEGGSLLAGGPSWDWLEVGRTARSLVTIGTLGTLALTQYNHLQPLPLPLPLPAYYQGSDRSGNSGEHVKCERMTALTLCYAYLCCK
jgi:hypothetical protein